MKIAYICSSGEPVLGRGAASAHIQEMCLALQSLGRDVFIIARNRGQKSAIGKTSLRIYEVAPRTRNQRFYHPLWRKFYSSTASPTH